MWLRNGPLTGDPRLSNIKGENLFNMLIRADMLFRLLISFVDLDSI
jgi:hypothetical protein